MDKAGYTFLIEKYELRVLEPLVHCFLVDYAFGIVLVVGVLELRASYGCPIDGHDDGVVLRKYGGTDDEHCN